MFFLLFLGIFLYKLVFFDVGVDDYDYIFLD